MTQIVPVVLSGGTGSRLWPVSRRLHPKQFIPFNGSEHSLLQQTAIRLNQIEGAGAPIVICNEEHRFMVAEQLRALDQKASAIILEPVGRNTAPAAALAALHATAAGEDPILALLPSDHSIQNATSFAKDVSRASKLAAEGSIVTFGVQPTKPETGYGYIRKGQPIGECAFKLDKFVEKPDADTAQRYVDSGDYDWNSGMFVFRASMFLEELGKHAPDILASCKAAFTTESPDLDFHRIDADAFEGCRSESIDYAVMEHTDKGVVVELTSDWNDVGSWSALWETGTQDEAGNVTLGDTEMINSSNCYLRGEERLITTIGTHNLAVIDTADAILVADLDQVQDVKTIVERLKISGREEVDCHRKVYRPWGSYQTLVDGDRFKVKQINVKPDGILSLQMHHHRAEHWVVVKGTAQVQKGEETFLLSEDQSTYIPIGEQHRLSNPGKVDLELIEVQSGSYLGEDDITRFTDQYGREGTQG